MKLVITGSSSGIGRSLVEQLLRNGHEVWGLARSDQSTFAAAQKGRFRASVCDVSEWTDVARVLEEVGGAWPHIDGLVTCAGTQGEIGPTITTDPLRWSGTIRSN